jgi:hypothetical protein
MANINVNGVSAIITAHCEMVYSTLRAMGFPVNTNDTNKVVVTGMINASKTERKGEFQFSIYSTVSLPVIRHVISLGGIEIDGSPIEEMV